MHVWIKILIIFLITIVIYREIIKSAARQSTSSSTIKSKATILSFMAMGAVVGSFTYIGMSITLIETRDLYPYTPEGTPQIVSIFDKGIIRLNKMVIKTNLAKAGELSTLANQLTQGCNGNDGCEAKKIFDYVTHIPYRTDNTSRNAKDVVKTNWGDCDDKSNLFASLLNERGIDYKFVYVPHHVFVVVHVENKSTLPFLKSYLTISGKSYYYTETTAAGSHIGEFNGQFPYNFEGVYDIKDNKVIPLSSVSFRVG